MAMAALMGWVLIMAAVVGGMGQRWDGVVITEADFQGLRAFKAGLVDRRGFLKSWNDSGEGACSGGWEGIKCVRGQVISISLPWRGLAGELTAGVAQLAALRKLNLHDNAIQGPIPAALGYLANLRGLYLFNNRFSGSIPSSLSRCLLLQTLDLSNNALRGGIPAGVAGAAGLLRLNLSRNSLSGVIPDSWTSVKLRFLALDDNRLSGGVPPSIGRLASLEVFNAGDNLLNGTLPLGFWNLTAAVTIDLAGNGISGELPAAIGGMKNLSFLSLKGNNFSGPIPAAVGEIAGMVGLDLSGNNFTGEIPAGLAGLQKLTFLNVSNNNLSGAVPPPLAARFPGEAFSGNPLLCGYKGSAACATPAVNSASPARGKKLSLKDVILIAVGSVLFVLLVVCCALLVCLYRKRSELKKRSAGGGKPASPPAAAVEGGAEAGGKLVHFDGPLAFAADDLLCATAEIMGKSTYGTAYKATLEDGSQVAVKRLREKIAKGQREFEAEAAALGKVRHPNLLPLRAYYLGPKGEKLLVYDFMPMGSLAAFLHARAADRPADWRARARIMAAAARGLAHLHDEEKTVHGNLTAANVLLDEGSGARLADFGLWRLMTGAANANAAAAAAAMGYRAPELGKLKKVNAKTDVYSLGVIMLELLTGKAPGEAMDGQDLPQWVASIVKEEWTSEVFDVELMREGEGSTGDQLLNALKLALHCVDPSPSARPEAGHVLRQLEEIVPPSGDGRSGSSAPPSTSSPPQNVDD